MTVINFTLGNGEPINVDVGADKQGILVVSQTNGANVTFPYDVTQSLSYTVDYTGTLVGANPFTIGAQRPPVPNGWSRNADNYYWKGNQEFSPLNWNTPKSDRPSYKIAVGSNYYSQNYYNSGTQSYLVSGINQANPDYLIPTKFTMSNGGNDPSCYTVGIDGRKYTAILLNGWRGGQCPCLFYQDPNSSEWCQYFYPFDPDDTTYFSDYGNGQGTIWSGGFFIFPSDMTISGYQFRRGNVIYLYCIPGNSAWQPTVFGVKAPAANCRIVFWGMADTIDQQPQVGGVVEFEVGNGAGGDPRPFIENGKLCYGTNATNARPQGFEIKRIDNLVVSGTASVTTLAGFDVGSKDEQGNQQNTECSCPIKLNNFNLMGMSVQVVNVNGFWNTLKNNNQVVNCDQSWNADLATRSIIDIGLDSYATALSAENPFDPASKRFRYGSTCMNWGVAGSIGITAYGTKPGLPWLGGVINDNGKMKFDDDNFIPTNSVTLPIAIYYCGTQVTSIIDSGGLKVDYANTVNNIFPWKQTKPVPAPNVLPSPAAYGQIIGIKYWAIGKILIVLIQTDANHHDILCTFYFGLNIGQYFSAVPVNGYPNQTVDAYNWNFSQNSQSSVVYIRNGTNIWNGWTNDCFGYAQFSDGFQVSCVLSGSPQHIYLFGSHPKSKKWIPTNAFNPFGTTWNGGLVICRHPMTISNYNFAQDDVILSCCSSGSAGAAYLMKRKGASAINLNPVLTSAYPTKTNDPRICIDYITKRFVITFVNSNTTLNLMLMFCTDFAKAQYTTPIDCGVITAPYKNNRLECTSPVIMNGHNYLSFSIQTNSSNGTEGDFIATADANWKITSGPWALNIGKYNYAASVSQFGDYDTHTYIDADGKTVQNTGYRYMYVVSNFTWNRGGNPPYAVGTFIEMFENNGFIDYVVPQNAVMLDMGIFPAGNSITAGNYPSNPASGGRILEWSWMQGTTYKWTVIRQLDANSGIINGHSTVWTQKTHGIGV